MLNLLDSGVAGGSLISVSEVLIAYRTILDAEEVPQLPGFPVVASAAKSSSRAARVDAHMTIAHALRAIASALVVEPNRELWPQGTRSLYGVLLRNSGFVDRLRVAAMHEALARVLCGRGRPS
jgi:hypothetical protein